MFDVACGQSYCEKWATNCKVGVPQIVTILRVETLAFPAKENSQFAPAGLPMTGSPVLLWSH